MNKQEKAIVYAAHALADALEPGFPFEQLMRQFTCREADLFVDVIRATGHDDLADALIRQHAVHDEKGDAHHIA